jgi:alkylhydroperoxidase/carboxymuconolactone decarboxylase family protein YurZ
MAEDALWYEAAQVVGITNALNVVADALGGAAPDLLGPLDEAAAGDGTTALFAEIRDFYAGADVPLPFRVMARDPAYAADVWGAVKRAFSDNRLPRRLKEALAFAVSLTTRSRSGTAFHLGEMRRLGVGPRGVMEVLGVAQMFSSYTKIADTLQLEPDMGDIAPGDPSPAPGGRAVARIASPGRPRPRAGSRKARVT